jgi:RimJ/RimL family protein N-acetyltransferase
MMVKEPNQDYQILAKGELVLLRTHMKTDSGPYQRWQTQGEWLSLDAPWERNQKDKEQNQGGKNQKSSEEDSSAPQKMAVITTLTNSPLGWVTRYSKRNTTIWHVGIDICEDEFLNRGYGTEALTLWVDCLFENSNIHKIGLDTWSFNPRMIKVAEKIGFIYEGCQREMQFWQGEWLDLMHYGMLRKEWEVRRYRQL